MVEMRWYTHPSTPVNVMYSWDGKDKEKTIMTTGVRVLQYRVLRDVTPVTTETHVAPFPFSVTKEWTEWMDVPEIIGESAEL